MKINFYLREDILATPLPRSYESWTIPLIIFIDIKSPLPELCPPLYSSTPLLERDKNQSWKKFYMLEFHQFRFWRLWTRRWLLYISKMQPAKNRQGLLNANLFCKNSKMADSEEASWNLAQYYICWGVSLGLSWVWSLNKAFHPGKPSLSF